MSAAESCVLSGDAFFADPYPLYAKLRALDEPVQDQKTGAWLISRYADVQALLLDARTSKRVHRAELSPFEQAVLSQDPPEHSAMRALLNQVFTGSAVLGIEARVTAIADRLLDHMEAGGRFDFIAAFALPLPVALICEIMGIPEEDTPRLHQWSSAFLLDDSVPEEEAGRRLYGAMTAMTEYFAELIAARERKGGEDLLSQMIGAEENGRRLSRDELIGNAMLLLIAGHETTVNLLGNGLLLLLEERDRWEQVQRQPQLLRLGIEEMLRFESPVQLGTYRVAAEPIAIGRRTIEAGAQVTLMLGSANRDPLQFPDPDRFDLARTPNRHLGFGHGPHRCIGAALARIEARLGFTRVIERFPNLRLDTPGPRQQSWFAPIRSLLKLGGRVVPAGPLWRHNPVTRGLRELRVIA